MAMNHRLLRPRASGGGFDPRSISGLVGWWDAADAATLFDATAGGDAVAADGVVARWQDKSGLVNHATQGTLGSRPLRKVAAINGRDALRFDGTDDSIAMTTQLAANAYTVAVAARKWNNSTDTFIALGAAGAQLPYAIIDIAALGTFGANGNSAPTPGAFIGNSSRQLLRTTAFVGVQDSTIRIFIDGTEMATSTSGAAPGASTSNFATIGARVSTIWSRADLGELLFYNRILADTERQRVEQYLRGKWGTP